MTMSRTARENLRQEILDAAEARLWRYGLKKTTIDEIAADAGIGKGTVYLYFDSKETIACALVAKYKESALSEQEQIARDRRLTPQDRIRRIIRYNVMSAHARCAASPEAAEVILTLRPRFASMMRPYLAQEVALIAEVIEEGIQKGIFCAQDSLLCARAMKFASIGFMPPYPCVETIQEIETELDNVIDMGLRSLKPSTPCKESQKSTDHQANKVT